MYLEGLPEEGMGILCSPCLVFCPSLSPLSPLGRGLNENTNGLIRQYLPKGTDLNQLTSAQIELIMEKLNNWLRKCLASVSSTS